MAWPDVGDGVLDDEADKFRSLMDHAFSRYVQLARFNRPTGGSPPPILDGSTTGKNTT
jgi:hypothetical protein